LLNNEALVKSVLENIASAPLSDAEKALLRFVEKVNVKSTEIVAADIQALHAHGWTDEAIYDAITVCALFNFFNRWIDATGVHAMSDDAHRLAAERMAAGYRRTPL